MEDFFSKKVDKRSRAQMIDFLSDHFMYPLMNSWNGINTFANRVKIHYLNLPRAIGERAWEILEDEYHPFWSQMRERIRVFQEEQRNFCTIYSNGRSGGYLILSPDKGDRYQFHTSREEYEDRYHWGMADLVARTELVQAFDRTCDLIRGDFIYYCEERRPLMLQVS